MLVEGMSWRRLTALVAALDGQSIWRMWRQNRPLEGDAALAAFHAMATG